jgi:hypothetical protein
MAWVGLDYGYAYAYGCATTCPTSSVSIQQRPIHGPTCT